MNQELNDIQSFLEITISEDINEAIERGNSLSVYIARTGKLLADAKKELDMRMQSEVISMLQRVAKETPNATSKTVNALTDSLCREEKYMVNWIERLNRTATHQLDWMRTLVSKAKHDSYYSSGVSQTMNR